MNILEIISIIILGAILFAAIFVLVSKKGKNNDFAHIDALYSLEESEILVDKFTAHRIKFDAMENWRKYRNVTLKYNSENDNYTLLIKYISKEHKEETLRKICVN